MNHLLETNGLNVSSFWIQTLNAIVHIYGDKAHPIIWELFSCLMMGKNITNGPFDEQKQEMIVTCPHYCIVIACPLRDSHFSPSSPFQSQGKILTIDRVIGVLIIGPLIFLILYWELTLDFTKEEATLALCKIRSQNENQDSLFRPDSNCPI